MDMRTLSVSRALYLEVGAMIWLVVEAILSLAAASQAHSLALTGFGMDSLIELVSAGILVWRLRVEMLGVSDDVVHHTENVATWWTAGLLGLLFLYLMGGSIWALTVHNTVRPSLLGVLVMVISGLLMVLIARRKKQLGVAIQSTALQADAMESWTCAFMAWTGLAGTLGVWVLGWTWMDPAAALIIAYWVAKEAWEAFAEVREPKN